MTMGSYENAKNKEEPTGKIYFHPGEFQIPCTEEQFVASGGTIFYYQTESGRNEI